MDASSAVLPDDGRLRAAVLRAAGFAPHLLTIAPSAAAHSSGADRAQDAPAGEHLIPRREARAAVRAALASKRFELALVASSSPGGDSIAGWLPAGLPAHWWPGGLFAGAPPRRMPWAAPRALAAIGSPDAGSRDHAVYAAAATHTALDWAIVDESAHARPRLSLWDGDYLLVPAALAGETGERLITAFATVARDHDALDLIVLADPQPAFERLARGQGVGTRVHFAGAATREAEWSWLKPASGVLIAGPGPIAAGVVVRALACGCPVLGAGADGVGPALNAWLAARGAAVADGGSMVAALRNILDRTAPVERAVERGRRESAAHRVAPLAARLCVSLAVPAPAVRPAATASRRRVA